MKRSMLALIPAVAAIAAAGCAATGGSHYATETIPGANARPASSATGSTLALRSTKLGKILVDSHGRTLYLFEKDTGTRSTCFGACAAVWPPLTVTGAHEQPTSPWLPGAQSDRPSHLAAEGSADGSRAPRAAGSIESSDVRQFLMRST